MKFILNKDNLTIENPTDLKSGSINYYEADVEYDETWNNLIIEAKLIQREEEIGSSVSLINNQIFIDKQLKGKYFIGFVGYTIENNEKTYQISTNLKSIVFHKGAGEIETQNEDLPTPTEWEVYIAQIQEMLDNVNGVPNGGTTGQVLAKKSNADKDVEWKTIQGGGSGGTTNHAELDNLDYVYSGHTGFQPTLVSGQNIKTINNQSILGSGDITIVSDVKVNNVSVVSNGIANVTVPTSLSQLSEDTTHRIVTDTEKQTWNNKSNFSGSYNDLSNKPTIPAEVTETTVSNWGFTKNTGTYSKPSGGIPETDLASDVQTSLGKADTSIQQSDLTNYQLKPTTQTITETSATITPVDNTIYECGELTSLTITNPPATGMYVIIFTSGTTATTTTIPSSIVGVEQFSAEANTRYEINVRNGYAVVGSWEV